MLNLDDYQVEWVCKHLGHTQDVHKLYYKQTSGAIERIQIGKLMLLQDLNLVGQFRSKRLEDIQFEGKNSSI